MPFTSMSNMAQNSWRTRETVPITQRGVHPLLLESLAAQTLDPATAAAAGLQLTGAAVRLGDLTVRQVADLVVKPAVGEDEYSYMEALHAATPLSYFTVDEMNLSYQGFVVEDGPAGSVRVNSQPAFMGGSGAGAGATATLRALVTATSAGRSSLGMRLPSHAAASGGRSSAGSAVPGVPAAPMMTLPSLKTAPASLEHGSVGASSPMAASPVFYVVHSWDTNFGELVRLIKAHYEEQIWAGLSPQEGKEQASPSFMLPHKLQAWRVKHQAPIFYFVGVLCFYSRGAESWLAQQCHRALACSDSVLVVGSPSLQAPHVTKSFWNLFEVLLTALLQKPLTMLLPGTSELTQERCMEHMSTVEIALSDLDLASALTCHAEDRDVLTDIFNTWTADMPLLPNKTTAGGGSGGSRQKPQGFASALDLLQEVLRARLRSAAAEALFWGHLHTRYKLKQVVMGAQDMARRIARQNVLLSENNLYRLALHKQEEQQPASRLAGMLHKAVAVVNTLLTPAHPEGSTPASQGVHDLGVQWEIEGHISAGLSELLAEARRGSPAAAQVPIKCTCKCAGCATRLKNVMAINAKTGANVYQAAASDVIVKGGVRKLHIQNVLPDNSLAAFFPTFVPASKENCLQRADQLCQSRTRRETGTGARPSTNGARLLPTQGQGAAKADIPATVRNMQRRLEMPMQAASGGSEGNIGVSFARGLLAYGAANNNPERQVRSYSCSMEISLPGSPEPSALALALPNISLGVARRASTFGPDVVPGLLRQGGRSEQPSPQSAPDSAALWPAPPPPATSNSSSSPAWEGSRAGLVARKNTVLMVPVPLLTDDDPPVLTARELIRSAQQHEPLRPSATAARSVGKGGRVSNIGAMPARAMRFEDMVSLPPLTQAQ